MAFSFPPIAFVCFAAAAAGALSVIFLISFLISDKLTDQERRLFVVLGGPVSVLAAVAITAYFVVADSLRAAASGAFIALIYSGVSSLLLKRRDSVNQAAASSSSSAMLSHQHAPGSGKRPDEKMNPIVLVAIIQGIASVLVAAIALLK